ncbi:hypothetical protein Glove_384g51 [Diversispora epigaea]|uniref:Zn(2)-C6 fungal-type domain-containing protein n=1 Tax=Diversispora epigaea TaxID=1348612 RepID=A0A397H7R1_9GLOM|nr:hypothetical protein Glove_384g52 [Diversispora epigaea]RHZ57724.1 hypothetical protein Glove_384g51 [Diversispora epigaea]
MNKTNRTHVTVACRNCQKAKKKCSDYKQNPSCERCVKKGLECEYIQSVLKRGRRQIHVNESNRLSEDDNNISRDDDIFDLSRKYGLHFNAVRDLKETYPNEPFDLMMKTLTATTNKKCPNDVNHICHAGCFITD